MTDREELLFLLRKLRAHVVSSRELGEVAEAESFEAKVTQLMTEHGVTEAELNAYEDAPLDEVPAPKLHCYRVLYAAVTVDQDGGRHAAERQRFVVARDEVTAGAAVVGLHPGLEVQVQQVAMHAKDVVLA